MHVERLGHRKPDREARIERGVRILEHHLHFAPQRPHCIGAAAARCRGHRIRSRRRRCRPGAASERPVVDLPQPDSPTSARVSPRVQIEAHLFDRVHASLHAAEETAGQVEAGFEAAHREQRRSRVRRLWRGRRKRRRFAAGLHQGKACRQVGTLHRAQTRHRGQERARVRIARRMKNGLRRALLDQFARVHDQHAVGDLGHHAHVVGDEHHRHVHLALQAADQARESAPGW